MSKPTLILAIPRSDCLGNEHGACVDVAAMIPTSGDILHAMDRAIATVPRIVGKGFFATSRDLRQEMYRTAMKSSNVLIAFNENKLTSTSFRGIPIGVIEDER